MSKDGVIIKLVIVASIETRSKKKTDSNLENQSKENKLPFKVNHNEKSVLTSLITKLFSLFF